MRQTLGRLGLVLTCCGWATLGGAACVEGDTARRLDTSDIVPDNGPDLGPSGDVAIEGFSVDFVSITRGPDSRGRMIDGRATLTWTTANAASVEVLVDGVPISLDACVPEGERGCAAGGSLEVRPSAATTFTLRAVGSEGTCPGVACPEASVEVDVRAPVVVTLTASHEAAQPGSDVEVAFEAMNHETFAVGRVDFTGPAIIRCGEIGSRCEADEELVDGRLVGVARFAAVDRAFAVGVEATNGAADGLGDIAAGDLFVEVGVPVVVAAFVVEPAQALPGSDVVLRWEVAGAQSVSVSADEELAGLSTCVGLGEDGRGFCTVTVSGTEAIGPIGLVLLAEQEGGAAGEAQAVLGVIAGPTIGAFSASREVAVPGQGLVLEWTAFGADAVSVVAEPAVIDGLSGCVGIGADGRGSCEVTVANGADLGAVTLRLEASNASVGPAATATSMLQVLAAPTVLGFDVDDVTVEPGTRLVFDWEVAEAETVLFTEASGAIAGGELERCAPTVGGVGGCQVVVPAGLPVGATLDFSLRAVGPTGARSAPATLTVTVGRRPEVSLVVSPGLLPEGGGAVTLTWVAPTATQVEIMNDEGTVVIGDGAGCVAGPCDAEGDEAMLVVDRPTRFVLTAQNEFGIETATGAVGVEGAPVIDLFEVAGEDALAMAVLVEATATVSWSVSNLGATDEVRLERAPKADGGCDGVPRGSWEAVDGFPRVGEATGQATVAFDGTGCLRLVGQDLDTEPNQRAVAVVLVYRAPTVGAFVVDDATVKAGDRVVLSWTTAFAERVVVEVEPDGAVTSQELAGCAAATGACEVAIQGGVTPGEVRFELVAVGELGVESDAQEVVVAVGLGPSIGAFTAEPGSVAAATDVTLRWTSERADTLEIRGPDGVVFSTTAAAVMASGSQAVAGVATSTTWTLEVVNAFGVALAQATTFVGPSIDALTVNGGNALDGVEAVVSGPVTVSWATTSADGSHRLEAGVPANGGCAAATGWAEVYVREAPTASGSHGLGVVTVNRCVRLTVANRATPPQTSVATFLVREMPEVVSLGTSPGTLNGSGTVIVRMGVRGANALGLTAQYRNAAGEVLGTRNVCTQAGLNSGALTGGAGVDAVECAHAVVACNLLCLNNGMPSGTARIRYFLSVNDTEGDAATANTGGGADVTVQ